jgi:hypothetical protein
MSYRFSVKSFKNDAENKIRAKAFSQISRVSETQVTQNDKTNAVTIAVLCRFALLARLLPL